MGATRTCTSRRRTPTSSLARTSTAPRRRTEVLYPHTSLIKNIIIFQHTRYYTGMHIIYIYIYMHMIICYGAPKPLRNHPTSTHPPDQAKCNQTCLGAYYAYCMDV